MTFQETASRVYHITHSGNLQTAFGENEQTLPVSEGRGLYLLRLEIPTDKNPEVEDRRFGLAVRTNQDHIYRSKGLGGGKKGRMGEPIPFEDFVKTAARSLSRITTPGTNPIINEAIRSIFGDVPYNCNAHVLTEFNGYWAGLGSRYDELRTHLPLIVEALKELPGKNKL